MKLTDADIQELQNEREMTGENRNEKREAKREWREWKHEQNPRKKMPKLV